MINIQEMVELTLSGDCLEKKFYNYYLYFIIFVW